MQIHDARWQADPERRAACGPSTGSGAAAWSCLSQRVSTVRQTGILLSAGKDCLSAGGIRLSAHRDFAMSADSGSREYCFYRFGLCRPGRHSLRIL
jgi:hypothetical protein